MKRTLCIFAIYLGISLAAWSASDIYKWTDEKGQIHYGDQPPAGVAAERVTSGAAPRAQPNAPADAGRDPNAELRDVVQRAEAARAARASERQAAAAAAQARSAERAALDEQCFEARTRLAVLGHQQPVYRDEQGRLRVQWMRDTYTGKREYIDDATRATEVTRAERDIGATCLNPTDPNEQARAQRQLARSELCAAGRAELAELAKPSARLSRSEFERKQAEVAAYCGA